MYIAIPEAINGSKTDFNDVVCTKGISAVQNALDKAISYTDFRKKMEDYREIKHTEYNNIMKENDTGFSRQVINMQKTDRELADNEREIY